jgi:hypothetical protein
MASAHPITGKFLVDLSSADDLWKKLADSTPAPAMPKLSRSASRPPAFPTLESTTAGYERIARVRETSAGFVEQTAPRTRRIALPPPRRSGDPWHRTEQRLWYVAGALMGLAVAVLTVLALVTFSGNPTAVASVPTSPIPGLPELTVPVAAPAPSSATASAWRPPLPARVRAAEPAIKPVVVAKKHPKHHKAKDLARK